MLESFNSSSLRRVDLAISGERHMGTYRDWRGEARGGKEIDGEGLRKNLGADVELTAQVARLKPRVGQMETTYGSRGWQ